MDIELWSCELFIHFIFSLFFCLLLRKTFSDSPWKMKDSTVSYLPLNRNNFHHSFITERQNPVSKCKCRQAMKTAHASPHYLILSPFLSLSSGPCLYLLDRSLHLKWSVSQMNKVSPKTTAGMTNRAGHTLDTHTHTHTHKDTQRHLPPSPTLLLLTPLRTPAASPWCRWPHVTCGTWRHTCEIKAPPTYAAVCLSYAFLLACVNIIHV